MEWLIELHDMFKRCYFRKEVIVVLYEEYTVVKYAKHGERKKKKRKILIIPPFLEICGIIYFQGKYMLQHFPDVHCEENILG